MGGGDSIVIAQSGCVSQGAVSPGNTALAADCETLLSARDSLEGTASLNWSASTPIEDWEGVSIAKVPPRVVGIWLGERGLTGTIPSELGNLTKLKALSLSDNQLSGTIPTELGNLAKLTKLFLGGNELSGSIPTELGSLSELTKLFLGGNELTGCIPDGLRDVEANDLDQLGLPFCDPQALGSPNVSMAVAGAPIVRIDSPIQVTATFSEPVSGFTVEEVSVTNGSASSFVGIDGDSAYTFDVTPNAIGDVTVNIAAGAATDAAGIGNTAAVQLSLGIPYDDNGNGEIDRDEVIAAIGDYLFNGTLIRDHVITLIGLYLFG